MKKRDRIREAADQLIREASARVRAEPGGEQVTAERLDQYLSGDRSAARFTDRERELGERFRPEFPKVNPKPRRMLSDGSRDPLKWKSKIDPLRSGACVDDLAELVEEIRSRVNSLDFTGGFRVRLLEEGQRKLREESHHAGGVNRRVR